MDYLYCFFCQSLSQQKLWKISRNEICWQFPNSYWKEGYTGTTVTYAQNLLSGVIRKILKNIFN